VLRHPPPSTDCSSRSTTRCHLSPLAAGVTPRAAAALHRGVPPAAAGHCLPHQRCKGVGVKHRPRCRRLLLLLLWDPAAVRLLLLWRGVLLLRVLRRGCTVLLLLLRPAAVLGWWVAVPTLGPKPWLRAHPWLAVRRESAIWWLVVALLLLLLLLLGRTILRGWRLAVLCWRPLLERTCRGRHGGCSVGTSCSA
jgi:hypothetical protein